jgi:transposase
MRKPKRMDQIKAIIENYLATGSIKRTVRQLKISKNTVRGYLRRGQEYNEDLSKILDLEDEELRSIFYPEGGQKEQDRARVFALKAADWLGELRRVGVTRQLLWEEYREEYPEGYGYSQFCERLKKEIGRNDLTLSLSHVPGEVMMVDFAGKKLRWVDQESGEVHTCEVLVCVFPHTQYTFAIALPSQQIMDFVYGLNQALLFFGGLPKVILSDNLKSYVTYADRYEPRFTQLCEQLGAHYQLDLQSTRVASPKDKASVESAVGIAYKRIYAPLRNEEFDSLEDLNVAILGQLIKHNFKPYQKKEGCRKSMFERYELPQMSNLPSELFEVKKITKAKVQRNYHVYIGEEKNYYSVPYRYAGCKAEVIYSSKIVEVYVDSQRIAIHPRLFSRGSYRYQTQESHMPKNHQEWKKAQGYDAAYFLEQADKIGPLTRWAMEQILLGKIHEAQTYNSCKGVLSLARKYTNQRLEKATQRCKKVNKVSYLMLKRILVSKLDQADAPPEQISIPFHENLRGPDCYQ